MRRTILPAVLLFWLVTSPVAAQGPGPDRPSERAHSGAATGAALPPALTITPDSTFAAWQPQRSVLRPTLEMAGVMGLGLAIYIYKGERNAYDWGLNSARVRERFTTWNHFRFDDNEFAMNNAAHPVAGALYYGFARSNGYGPFESFLWSLGSSSFWEIIIELREVASLNDLISTPTSGFALGEAFHQHEMFFRRAAPTRVNRFLDRFFGGPILLNRAFDEPIPPRSTRTTHSGLPADRPHDIRLDVAYGTLTKEGRASDPWVLDLRASSEIGSVAGAAGAEIHRTGGAPVTALELGFGLEDGRLVRFDLGALAAFPGLSAGGPGSSLLLGPATQFHVHTADVETDLLDMQAVASVLGLRADWAGGADELRARLIAEGYADFSSVRPMALYQFWAHHALPLSKHILYRNQYYYAWGWTGGTRAEIEWRGLGLSGSLDHHAYESFDGRHRKVEHGPDTLHASDRRTYLRASLEYALSERLRLGAWLTEAHGRGDLGGYTNQRRDRGFGTRLTYRF